MVLVATGEGSGTVRLYTAAARAQIASAQPFGAGFTGGVRVAVGDLNADGITDFVIGAGPGSGHVLAYSGADYGQLASFAPFGSGFTGGVYVATGDIDADGRGDIIVGGGLGSGLVGIFSGVDGHEIFRGAPFSSGYSGGVTVAAGDVNGDGRTDLIVATAVGGLVEVFDGASASFMTAGFPYGPLFFGGVNVAVGDVDGDGRDDVITAPRTGGGLVHVFRINASLLASIVPFPAADGVSVAAGDVDGDGFADVVVGAGSGAVPQVRVFSYRTQSEIATYLAAEPTFAGGVFVAASHGAGAGRFLTANAVTFREGVAQDFAIRATGGATIALSVEGALPAGLTFTDHGNGSATLGGTPATGTGGIHALALVARRGGIEVGRQAFTLTIEAPVAITSASSTTWIRDAANTFTVTTTGFPRPTLSSSGGWPTGVTFADQGDGTARLSGTATVVGSFTSMITATNSLGETATQTFTLTVNPATTPPTITSANATTFTVGAAGSFTVTTDGVPTVATISATGALPAGITFTNNGDGTAVLAGTPAAGTGGTYALVISASNGVGSPATQNFTLTIHQAAALTSGNATTFLEETSGTFTVTATGMPIPALTVSGALPSGVTFVDNGNRTATLAGEPADGSAGTYVLTLTATNGVGVPATATFTLTVENVNKAPSFTRGPDQTVLEDAGAQTVAGWATAISAGPNEPTQTVAFEILTTSNPSLFSTAPAVSAAGVLTFTPAPNANGVSDITLRLTDDGGTANGGINVSAPQTFRITVTAVNDAPTADDDAYGGVAEGGTLVIPAPGVLDGDTDVEGGALTGVLVGGPSFAAAFTLNANGSFTYTHNGSESSTDTLTYRASDGALDSNLATVTITITPVNDAPVAVNDSYTVAEAGTLTIAAPGVIANDTDAEGNPLTASIVSGPASAAAFTLNLDGSFTYAHDGSEVPLSDAFTYRVSDGIATSNVATVTITITPVNEAPVLDLDADDSGGTTGANYATTFTENGSPRLLQDPLDATLSDVDHTTLASLTVTLTNLFDPARELLDVDLAGFPAFTKTYDTTTTVGQGILTITAATAQPIGDYQTLLRRVTYQHTGDNPNTTAREITFVASDGSATSNIATSTVTLVPVNDPPTADNDSYTVAEAGTLAEAAPGVLDGDQDPEGAALTAALVTGPANAAAFTLNANGSFTYTHNGSEAASDSFTYRANDGTLNSNIATVTITITPVNDAPVAVDDTYTVSEGATLAPAAPGVISNDLDPEGNVLTAALVAGPSHAAAFTLNADGSFTYTHDGTESPLSDSFTYRVNDGSADSNVATMTLTITSVNDPAIIDLDADDSGGTSGVNYAVTFNENAAAVFLQDAADATITDGDNTTLGSMTVTLTNLLDPTFELLDVDLTGFPAFTKAYDTTTDPTRGVLTIAATPAQPIADFVALLRRVTYLNSDEGPDTTARIVTFVAHDGVGDGTLTTTTVTIVAADDPPTADNDAYSADEGGTLNVAAPGVLDGDQDPDGDALTAVLAGGPANASAFTLNADGSFTYTHDGSETTTDSFTYRASANAVQSNLATVTITVTSVNDAPTAVDDTGTTTEDAVLNAAAPAVLANDTDPDAGDTKTVVAVNGSAGSVGTPTTTAEGATVTLNADGSYSYDPTGVAAFQALGTGQTDTDTFTYTMADTAGLQSTATVTLTITGVNDAPVVAVGAGTPTFTEDGSPVAVAPALTVTDVDGVNLDSATIQITGNYQNGQDELVFTNQLGITGVWTPGTGTLALTGSATLANYQTALRSVTYRNTSQNPNTTARTVSFLVDDGDVNSNTDTKSVAVVSVNDAPTIAAGATITFTEGDAATPIDTTIVVNEVDDTNLESATVQITANYVNGQDILAMPVTAGIGSSFSAVTGTLTLTGSATLAAYQAALRTVTYFNGSNNPSQLARTVTWVVNDGDVNSAGATSTINVIAVNDPPTVLPETFELLGNTELRVDMAAGSTPHTSETTPGGSSVEGVLDNDSDPEGDPFAVTAITGCGDTTAPFDCTLPAGAVIHVDANGEFSYTPAPGATSGSFTYTVNDTPSQGLPSSVNGTVTFTFFDMIWYVDGTVAGPGTGTSIDPFKTFTAANLNGVGGAGDLHDTDDYIFVHDSTINSGIELETGQHLLAEFAGLSINRNLNGNGAPTNLVTAGGARTVLTNAAGNAIAIGSAMPAEIQGFALTGSVNAIDVTTAAALTGSATLTIANNQIVSAGAEGIDVTLGPGTTGTLTLNVQNNSWNTLNTHGPNAVDIIRNAGTLILDFSGNTNIKSSIRGLVIDGGAVANTFITGFANNSVHQSTLGHAVTISNVTFDASVVTGGIQQVNGGTLNIGVSGSPVGTRGVQLVSVQGNLLFTDLDVFAGESGLTVSGTGSGMTLSVTPATSGGTSTILAQAGAAVDATNVALDLRLSSLTSTTSASGVSLTTVSGTFSAPAGSTITKNGGGGAAFSVNNSAAGTTVLTTTYGGAINNTSGTGGSVLINTADAGSSLSFTGAITDNPGTGISLTTNTGATMSFSGGMTLNGGSSRFAATGGGTLNVTGTNTIGATTAPSGPALNVANTTIGGSGMTFRTISASGGVNGIVLNTTGATAGLTVTGNTGGSCGGTITLNPVGTPATVGAPVTADCTGGLIQNTTAAGISLTSTRNTSLTRMHVLNSGSDGLVISNIDGFTLANSFVTDATGVAGDRGIEMGDFSTGTAVNGAITISNSTLGPTPHDNFGIGLGSGTSSWSITSTVFTGSTINSGLNYELRNATVTSFVINGSVFQNQFADGMQMQPAGSSTGSMTATIQNSTFTGNNLHLDLNHDSTAAVTYNVLNNTFRTAQSHAFNLFSSAVQAPTTGGTLDATITGNVIGTAATFGSGSALGNGLRININGGADATVLVSTNTIRQTPNGRGIEVISRNGTGGLDITMTSNNVDTNFVSTPENGGLSLASIFMQSNCLTVCNTLRSDVRLNTVPAAAPNGELFPAQLALIESSTSTLQLVDTGAASASCTAQLTENNTGNAAANAGCSLIAGPIDTP